jgi:hypothetical protein
VPRPLCSRSATPRPAAPPPRRVRGEDPAPKAAGPGRRHQAECQQHDSASGTAKHLSPRTRGRAAPSQNPSWVPEHQPAEGRGWQPGYRMP